MLQRVVMLAAESLKVLEPQLMDGGQVQDVKVGVKRSPRELSNDAPLDLRVCAGGAAASSGCVRCFDSPEPQASPSAQPGCRPSRLQLQQGGLERRREPGRRGPARHRLQPGVPLLGRAQSESHLLAMWDTSMRLSTHVTLNFQDAFGDLALFFCDPHGGMVIAVLWKPKAFVPIPFKVRLRLVSFLIFIIRRDSLGLIPNYI